MDRVLKVAAVTLVLAMASGASAAGFDCSRASTVVEHMICDDPTLSRMDSEANVSYLAKLRASRTPADLRSEQRRWVREVRDRCTDPACLKSAYERRSYALQYGAQWMSKARADAICREVLGAANAGSLDGRFIALDKASESDAVASRFLQRHNPAEGYYVAETISIKHEGRTRRLGRLGGGGTCGFDQIYDLESVVDSEPFLQEAYDERNDDQELVRWAWSGSTDHLMILQGQLITVRTEDSSPLTVGLVSWLGPDGAKRPLCYLEPMPNQHAISVTSSRSPQLCEAVRRNKVEPVLWATEEKVSQGERQRGGIDNKRSATIDLNMDGVVDQVEITDYESSAGCGSYTQSVRINAIGTAEEHFTSVPERSDEFLWGPLDGWWSERSITAEGAIRLLRYEGKPYVLAAGGNGGNAVYSLWNGHLETWCTYRYVPRHGIRTSFLPESWPVPKDAAPEQVGR